MSLSTGRERRINIVQGEYHVSNDPRATITTLLGSCVAACLFDPRMRVGGMNHFLLPGDVPGEAERFGVHLMELLVNGLLKLGASRDRLEAKLFGGARTMRALSDIGIRNAVFAREFLRREGISIVGESLGGEQGRKLQYSPTTGRARQMLMAREELAVIETVASPIVPASSGELELF